MPLRSIAELSFELLSAQVKTVFHVQVPGMGVLQLCLSDVTPRRLEKDANGKDTTESFSLMFHGPASPVLTQKMYRFEHQELGEFDLFIVPIAREADGIKYEAVFNRLLNSTGE